MSTSPTSARDRLIGVARAYKGQRAHVQSARAIAMAAEKHLADLEDALMDREDTEHLAHTLAARACICDIELHAVAVHIDAQRWFDTRPMLDAREHCAEVIDMAVQALQYADARRLITRHPLHPYLVRIEHMEIA